NNKDVKATPEMIKKGFFFIDPIDSRALSVDDLSKAKVVDQNGNKVDGISFHLYNSLSEIPEFIQEQVKANNLQDKITGPFVVAQADDPQAFFDKYVKTGAKLKVTIPTIVKSGFTGEFSNTAYQFGFGKATPTNTVTNYVKPIPKPASPETPAAIAPQVISATAQPMTSDAPVTPSEKTAKLPQTGDGDDYALLGLAAASLVGSLGLAALGLKQNRNDD
ncbi:SspB-related isopeptide-forming adhesin, partial [Bifidobacterium longum]